MIGARRHEADKDEEAVAALIGADNGVNKEKKSKKPKGVIIPKIVRRSAPVRARVAGEDEVDAELELNGSRRGGGAAAPSKLELVLAAEEDDDELQRALAKTRRTQARREAEESEEAAAKAQEMERQAASRALAEHTEIVLSDFTRVDAT